MNLLSLFKRNKNEEDAIDVNDRSVEEFMTLVRVYYQGVIAVNLGVTNLNILPDLALFKRMLKIPTQQNKPGLSEKSRVRKILMQDYMVSDSFFKEIDASIKKNCRTQQHIQPYFFQFQGFCSDLFTLLDSLMTVTFRLSILFKKLLHRQTQKMIHKIMTQSEWKEVKDQKAAWSVRKYADTLGYSEQWVAEFVYHVMLLAKREAKKNRQ